MGAVIALSANAAGTPSADTPSNIRRDSLIIRANLPCRLQRFSGNSFQCELQPNQTVLAGRLVVRDQEYAVRLDLRVAEQCLLHGHGALLAERLRVRIADGQVIAYGLSQELDLGRRCVRLLLDGSYRLRILGFRTQIHRVQPRQYLELGSGVQ